MTTPIAQGPRGLPGSAALDILDCLQDRPVVDGSAVPDKCVRIDAGDDAAAFEADEKARIAALHKSAPEVIWLQVDPEAEQFDGWEAQTWCSDQINETDVKYVRADQTPTVELTGAARLYRAASSERSERG